MRTTVILAVTRAEIRTTLRLVHYWLFALLSVGIGCMVYEVVLILWTARGPEQGVLRWIGCPR